MSVYNTQFLKKLLIEGEKKINVWCSSSGTSFAHFHHGGALFTKLMSAFGTKNSNPDEQLLHLQQLWNEVSVSSAGKVK